jgi:hypothetical protein
VFPGLFPANSIGQGDHLLFNRVWRRASFVCRLKTSPAVQIGCLSIVTCLAVVAAQPVSAQDRLDAIAQPAASAAVETIAAADPKPLVPFVAETLAAPTAAESASSDGQVRVVYQEKPVPRPEQEFIVEGMYSYGNYKIFASGYDMKLYDAGIEYDRHSWGTFLKAQVDYVAEFLPFVLLDKPLHTDIWGSPVPKNEKNIRQRVPGIGLSPIGFRMQWRSNKTIKPYLEAKGGLVVFDKKVPSSEATYENFSLQSSTGVQVKLNEKWGLRLGLFNDFHFSDAFIVPVNPGLDVMNANLGVSYHF